MAIFNKARVARWLAKMPGSSKHFGPPRAYVDSISDLDAQECPHVERLREARTVLHELPPLDGYPELEEEIRKRFLRVDEPTQYLYCLPEARILGANFFHPVITNKDRFVLDQAAYELEQGRHPAHYSLKLPRCKKVGGTTFSLASRWSDNYWHWLFDCIGKWLLFSKASAFFDHRPGRVAGLNLRRCKFKIQSLSALGFADDQMVEIESASQFEFKSLAIAGNPSAILFPEMDLILALRDAFLKKTKPSLCSNKVFISRCKTAKRKAKNESELEQTLKQFGFQKICLEDYSFLEQVSIFQNASMIFSQHGAGLTNLAFIKPGTRVFELFEPEFVNPCYLFLAKKMRANYKILFNRKTDSPKIALYMVEAPDQVQVDCGLVARELEKSQIV